MTNNPTEHEGQAHARLSYSPSYSVGRYAKAFAIFVVVAMVASGGCSRKPDFIEQTFPAMGTAASVRVPAGDPQSLRRASHTVQTIAARLHALIDVYNPESEISKVNRIASSVRMPISRDTHRLLELTLHYGELTDGVFDITVAPLALMWGFGGGPVPSEPLSPELTMAALAGVGREHIQLHEDGVLSLNSPYTKISLSGAAQGYAVDLSIVEIRQEGIPSVLVNLG